LDFNGFCDNGDAKLFAENNNPSKKSTLVLNATLGGSAENLDQIWKSPSKTNILDLEQRALNLFKIILEFIFEILTKDDVNQLESELKVR